MGLNRSFEILSTVIERYERSGWGVRTVETDCRREAGQLRATIDLARPQCPTAGEPAPLQPRDASIAPDGRLRVEYASDDLPCVDDRDAVTASTADVDVAGGAIHLCQRVVIDPPAPVENPTNGRPSPSETPADAATTAGANAQRTESGTAVAEDPETEPASVAATVRNESVPAYEDRAYLEALYEACDTFTEMQSAIDMDVSAETVRRYMIDAGVHDPATYESTGPDPGRPSVSRAQAVAGVETSQSGGSDSVITEDQLRTDGVGLPADVALTEVVEAVANARSIYEVSEALGIDQDRARSLLRQLDCLDLVSYRLTDVHEGATPYEDVARRIRECTPDGA